MSKCNPIRICSCRYCRHGRHRRWYFKVANRKLRHRRKQTLRNLSDYEAVERILIAGGYTD